MLSRVFMLLCGTAGNAVIAFLTQLLLTRTLTVADYGRLSALMAAATLATPLAGLCIGWFWLELYGRENAGAARWGGATLRATVLTLAFAFLVLGLYVAFTRRGEEVFAVAWLWICLVLCGQTFSETRAIRLQLEERFVGLSLWQVVPQLLRSGVVLSLFALDALSGSGVLAGYGLVGGLVFAFSLPSLVRMTTGRVRIGGAAAHPAAAVTVESREQPGMAECVRAALPYALVTFFFLSYSLGILVMVELVMGREAAARYNVSYLVYAALGLVPSVVYTKYLASKIFRWWTHDRRMFQAAFHLGVFVHLIFGLVLGGAIALTAGWVIPLLFGPEYAASAVVLQILAIAVPIRFVQHGYGSVLFSKEHIRRKVFYMGVAALLSIGFLLLLAPSFGMAGAAMAAVLAELVLLLLYVAGAARHVEGIDVLAPFRWKTIVAARKYATGRS